VGWCNPNQVHVLIKLGEETPPQFGGIMSLISQRDREIVLKALDFYYDESYPLINEIERSEINALINWIKLEYYKNEN
jgi:hypothetical protein